MANEEQLAILRSGVEAWKEWRDANPEADIRLEGANFEGASLDGAILLGARLNGANFASASLRRATFWGSNLTGANFGYANLEGTNFWKASLEGASFEGANLRGASLEGANLEGANLGGAKLESACLVGSNLKGTCLKFADLVGADLWGANLRGASLEGAKLGGANLNSTDFGNVDIRGVVYDKTGKTGSFRGIRIATAYGSESFKRLVRDADYLDEFKTQHRFRYWVWWLVSDCGRSLGRWALLSLVLAMGFGLFFTLWPEHVQLASDRAPTWFTYFYYSIVTFTTLGFGDVTPIDLVGEIAVTIEVICGYVMLGGLLSILANKLARRS